MKEIETPRGILKYRMPNILEAYDMLDASGVGSGVLSTLKLKRNIIKAMAPLVDISSLDGFQTYEDVLNDVDNMIGPLSEIADQVIEKTFEMFKKKSS